MFVMAAGVDDMDNASSSHEDPTPQHETQEAERDMGTRQGTTQKRRRVLPDSGEDYTTGNEQGII